jgi:type VI secretion system protein ImpL
MKAALKWLVSPAVLGTLGVIVLSLLLWWVGPLIAFGSGAAVTRPLGGVTTRVIVVALLWLAWIGHLLWAFWRRRRINAALLQGIAAPASAADKEAELLAQRFRDAVAKLKGAGGSRLRASDATLYDLPWYVFVGAPGSGKTTALLNAGLDFVFADGSNAVKGVGGTRNCDWWFTREAVLIDTAGRYALQESDQAVDASAWDNFLALLRRTRPRRPINGVLLTVNVQDLLQQGATERQEHAAKLRARLDELQTKLGVQVPVYVVVTKTDLVAGFVETFDALNKDERDQVWGFTFTLDPRADALAGFDAQYRALEERLAAGLRERLQAERDLSKRSAMFGFVQEFASLQGLLGGFLRQVFDRVGTTAPPVLLRGVYFTSGTQEGTPIDRVMGTLARSFGLERRVAALGGGHGKSYFLRRLLQDLVFVEAHLVSHNPQAERRRSLLRAAGFAAVGVVAVAVLAGWAISWSRNQAYVEQVAARVPALKAQVDALPPATSADVAPLALPLAAVRDAAHGEGFALDAPPLLNTLGLYQGDMLDAGARQGYERLLQHALLPRVTQRLAERLRAANKDNLEQAYEALKSYLMLYTPAQFDPAALKAWIGIDWDVQLKGLPAEQRAALDQHLSALLELGPPQTATPQDTALVTSVRDMLASFPLEYRIYSRLKRQFRGDLPDFSVAAAAGPQAPKVFQRASGEPLSRGVPGFYTREGYRKAFQTSVATVALQLGREEQWVLGRPASATQAAGNLLGNEVANRVRRLYLEDYIKTWDAFLADVKLVPLSGTAQSLEVARILSGVDSPLAAFLRRVAAETTLVPPAAPAKPLDKVAQAANQAKADLAKMVDQGAAPAAADTGPIEKMVDDHFAAIHRLVEGQPSPLDDMGKAMADLYVNLQAVDAAQKSKSPPPTGGGAKAKAAAAQLPEPARSMIVALADAGEQQGRTAERENLTGDLKPIYDFCTRAIANRYPVAPSSRADILPEDFGQLFGVGGMLDDFYQRRLAPLVDTSGATWAYRPLVDGTRPATPAALADFQRAARIREAFFRSGGKQPGFKLDIKAVDLGGLPELTLEIDGQAYKLAAGGAPVTVSWPSQRVASQVKLSAGGTPIVTEGPWALFRLFDRLDVQPSSQPEKFGVVATLDGKRARLEVTANSVFNPFRLPELQQFRCPGAL